MRAAVLLLLACALTACPRQNQVQRVVGDGGTSSSPSPSPDASATPDAAATTLAHATLPNFARGTLGDRAIISMRLAEERGAITGSYYYESVGRAIDLRGTRAQDGAIDLEERVGDRVTGRFALRVEGASLQGTWTGVAQGGKPAPSFEVRLAKGREGDVDMLADFDAGAPIAPASRGELVAFLVRYASFLNPQKPKLSSRIVEEALDEGFSAPDSGARDTLLDDGIALELPTLYVADVDNDGARDYVLTDRNTVGFHNDSIVAIVTETAGGGFRALDFFGDMSRFLFDGGDYGPAALPYFGTPFLARTDAGITMHFEGRTFLGGHEITPPCEPFWEEHQIVLWRAHTNVQRVLSRRRLSPCE